MDVSSDQITRAAQQLLLAGGFLAIVLAPALLLLRTPLAEIQLAAVTGEVIAVILGLILIIAARQARRNALVAILFAFVASIILLALGGEAGLVGGLFGLVGAVVAAAPLLQDFFTLRD